MMHKFFARIKNITTCLCQGSQINLFIDTSSISHLSDLQFKDKNYFEIINEYFCLKTSQCIKEEFNTNLENRPESSQLSAKILDRWETTIKIDEEFTDKIIKEFFVPEYLGQVPKSNKGEIELTLTALNEIVSRNKDRIVFLIDDRSARNNFVAKVNQTFSIGEIWNSIDIVIFMYLLSIEDLTFSIVKEAIRDITSFRSFSTKDFRSNKNYNDQLARQSMLRHYYQELKRIKKLKIIINNYN